MFSSTAIFLFCHLRNQNKLFYWSFRWKMLQCSKNKFFYCCPHMWTSCNNWSVGCPRMWTVCN